MKLLGSIYLKFILLFSCYNCFGSSCHISNTLVTLTFVLSVNEIPSAVGFPFDFLFRRQRKDLQGTPPTQPPSKPPRFYQLATNMLDWAFKELDDSEEEKTGRFDPDRMTSSSSEEELEIPTLNTMKEKIEFLRKGRVGTVGRQTKVPKKVPPPKSNSDDYDDAIEQASVNELKNMLTKLKREEEGIFNSQLFANPVTSSLLSFGTSMFKKMYCGLRPQNDYCISDHFLSRNSVFDIFRRRRLSVARK